MNEEPHLSYLDFYSQKQIHSQFRLCMKSNYSSSNTDAATCVRQLAFTLGVYPAVLLTYSGQTAYLINHPDEYLQGFFNMIPTPVFWPMFVISTLAAIVASQGLITATFSVVKQSVALDYFPPVKVVHTSEDTEGQIYSPEVNFMLMILCLAVVFGFGGAAEIGNAFGMFCHQ